MCPTSPAKSPVGRAQTPKRTSDTFQIVTPDYSRVSRSADGYVGDYDECDTPKIMVGKSVGPALEFGLVVRTVPDVLDAGIPGMMDDDEPMTPRGAMLPLVPREPPAIKNVSALSSGWERSNHMFDDDFVLSPLKTLSSPGDVSFVSHVGSGESTEHE
jgi:hypothetical protein